MFRYIALGVLLVLAVSPALATREYHDNGPVQLGPRPY